MVLVRIPFRRTGTDSANLGPLSAFEAGYLFELALGVGNTRLFNCNIAATLLYSKVINIVDYIF
jgi:hypothetical protein